MCTRGRDSLVLVLFAVTTAGWCGAQQIPPLTDLTATSGAAPGEIEMDWNTPFFADPGAGEIGTAHFVFRASLTPIDNLSWGSALPLAGDIPVAVAQLSQVTLDLWVNAYYHAQTGLIYWDFAELRAWLSIQVNQPFYCLPSCMGIRNETINFAAKYNGNTVWTGSATTDQTGMAYILTSDLVVGTPYSRYMEFTAYWAGGAVAVGHGMILWQSQSLSDNFWMWMYNGSAVPPPPQFWSHGGGVYTGQLNDVAFTFTVPAGAVETDTPYALYLPSSVPPPVGMNPCVPGALIPFQLEVNGPPLLQPVSIGVQYPEYKLLEFGGVGESSLRAYRYDDGTGQWVLLDQSPIKLCREEHKLTFEAQELGLFAIAGETDFDHDGLGDCEELERQSDPAAADTDSDGVSDGDEAWFTLGDPLDPRKATAPDQHGRGEELVPGQGYFVAARILTDQHQSDVSNNVFVHAGYAKGDLNCDGPVNFGDINPFVLILTNPQQWQQTFPGCPLSNGDINADGSVNFGDINPFVALLTNP